MREGNDASIAYGLVIPILVLRRHVVVTTVIALVSASGQFAILLMPVMLRIESDVSNRQLALKRIGESVFPRHCALWSTHVVQLLSVD